MTWKEFKRVLKELLYGPKAERNAPETAVITYGSTSVRKTPRKPSTLDDKKTSTRDDQNRGLLSGRRFAQSPHGSKIHIVREVSLKKDAGLCGAPVVKASEAVLHNVLLTNPDLCKSCVKLARGGAQ